MQYKQNCVRYVTNYTTDTHCNRLWGTGHFKATHVIGVWKVSGGRGGILYQHRLLVDRVLGVMLGIMK